MDPVIRMNAVTDALERRSIDRFFHDAHPHEKFAMTCVVLGGSRHISKLNDEIRHRLDRILEQQFRVVIGDANGADKAFQPLPLECGATPLKTRPSLVPGGAPPRYPDSRSTRGGRLRFS